MKRFMATLCAASALAVTAASVAAWAQSAAPSQLDPTKMALARQLVDESGGQQAVKAQLDAMFDIVKKGVGQAMPAQESELTNQIYSDMEQQIGGVIPQLIDISVRAYAENYTEKELRDIITFNESDSGRAIRLKAPAIRNQALTETMPLIMKLMPEIMHKTAEHVCEVNHCNDKQREMITAALSKAVPSTSP